MEIKTKRLTLRPVNLTDAIAIFAYRSDEVANKYQGFIPKSLEEVEAFISNLPDDFNQDGTWFQLAVILTSENRLIGDIGLHFLKEQNRCVELGCTISDSNQGKGFATEALTRTKEILFDELGKEKLIASVDPRNMASVKMLEHIGMSQVSLSEKSYNLRGEWVDDAVYVVENV